jgi:putative ABC transport system permease protein
MFFWMTCKISLTSLAANKLRSVLAMLGIIIGIAAVIAMLAMGRGAQQQVLDRITAMGVNLLVVTPGSQRGPGGVVTGVQQNLTIEDAAALVSLPGVAAVAPVVRGTEQIKYFNNNTRTNVTGSSATYLAVRNFEVEFGRGITDFDCDAQARVAVLGPVTATQLFDIEEPIDKIIKIRGINFRVIGVLKAKGDQGWTNPDDQVLIPFTTAMKQVLGVARLREISIQAHQDVELGLLEARVRELLSRRHSVQVGAAPGFNVHNQADVIETHSQVVRTFTILISSMAGISLLVGGIGIMNIMLVTVTERTREIGIRKAIGAKDRDVLRQFMVEALIMSGLGGLLGVAVGMAAAYGIAIVTEFKTIVHPSSVALAMGFSAAVGIFFGLYPATRAAKLDPIEALRYE